MCGDRTSKTVSGLSIGGEEVSLQRIKSQLSSQPCCGAVLDQTVIMSLHPYSESVFPVRIEGLQSTKDKWGTLEPSGDGLHGIAGIMAGQTLVDLEQLALSPSACAEPLWEGAEDQERYTTIIGMAMCASVHSVLSKDVGGSADSKQALPDHLKDLYQRSIAGGLDPVRQVH